VDHFDILAWHKLFFYQNAKGSLPKNLDVHANINHHFCYLGNGVFQEFRRACKSPASLFCVPQKKEGRRRPAGAKIFVSERQQGSAAQEQSMQF
jgi:hypothetical protein